MTMQLAAGPLAAGAARLHDLLLRRRLHDVAEALDAAEHRHRRPRRRAAAGDRLGREDGRARARSAAAGRDHLHVDAAALLGARRCSRRSDYAAARVPMLPVTHGAKTTRRHIFAYSLLLAPLGFAPVLTGLGGPIYAAVAAARRRVLPLPRLARAASRARARATRRKTSRRAICSASRSSISSRCSPRCWLSGGIGVSETVILTPEEVKARKRRNLWIALADRRLHACSCSPSRWRKMQAGVAGSRRYERARTSKRMALHGGHRRRGRRWA